MVAALAAVSLVTASAGPGLELHARAEPLAAPDAEAALVGAWLVGDHPERLARAADIAVPDMLTSRPLRLVYASVVRLHGSGQPVDMVTLEADLRARGEWVDAGGFDVLSTLVDAVPTAARVEAHAQIVRDLATRRRLRDALRATLLDVDTDRALPELLAGHDARLDPLRTHAAGQGPELRTLAELLADPATTEPPAVVAPRLAWRGRVALLAAREKAGKSTLASAAVAAVSQGHRLLGDTPSPGPVLVVSLEEHVGDLGRRLLEYGARADAVYVLDRVGPDPCADVAAAVTRSGAVLTVIDTLAALVEGLDLDPGSATAWTPVMARLTRIARDSGTALLVLHHARKSDGQYRDSSAIGAAADAILTMTAPAETPDVRHIRAVGRWPLEDFRARYVPADDGRPAYFELADRELGIEARIISAIGREPGCSARHVESVVRGRSTDIRGAIHRLLSARQIEDRGTDRGARYHLVAENPHGHATDAPGTHSGRAPGRDGGEVRPTAPSPPVGGRGRDAHPDAGREA